MRDRDREACAGTSRASALSRRSGGFGPITTVTMASKMSDMPPAPTDPSDTASLPPDLRFLKVLVTALAGTMILGLITIVALLVIRLPKPAAPRPALPEALRLPEGLAAEAVTMGRDWLGIVASGAAGEEILIFDGKTGTLRQRIPVIAGPGAP